MGWTAIILALVENAPAIIDSAPKFIAWANSAFKDLSAAYNKPADQVTKEELLARLDRIKALSAQIQAID